MSLSYVVDSFKSVDDEGIRQAQTNKKLNVRISRQVCCYPPDSSSAIEENS
jgi:hypothetical protein